MSSGTVTALQIDRDVSRFAAARIASTFLSGAGARPGPLTLTEMGQLPLPGPDWLRIRPRMTGICGSDLATVDGRSSRWFEPIVSFPFVPGHEVVADDPEGRRVVVEPVLGCVARSINPMCAPCSRGDLGNCEHISLGCGASLDAAGNRPGHLEPGLQSGYCCDTGGGWSTEMLAHPSQLHEVPDELDDRAALLIEPTACGVHAALAAEVQPDETVAVIGAGTLGLVTIAALARWTPPGALIIAAKHPHQRRLATELGSTASTNPTICGPEELLRAVRRNVGAHVVAAAGTGSRLSGGADVTLDCVGNADSIAAALAVTRPGGRIVLVGMPGVEHIDLTPLWQREISLKGAYAYGTERIDGRSIRTFDLATELVAAAGLGRLVSATYPLDRFGDALSHAGAAGRRGAIKIAFDLHQPDHPAVPRKAPRR